MKMWTKWCRMRLTPGWALVFVLLIFLMDMEVGGSQEEEDVEMEVINQRIKDLLDSFAKPEGEEDPPHHKIRHHRHRHHHGSSGRRKGHQDEGAELIPPPVHHSTNPLDDPEVMLPLYPKNVSEETLIGLKRLKRQYYGYQDPYGPPHPQPVGGQARYYVSEDGSELRDDGRDEWSGPSECSRPCGGGVASQEKICRDPLRQGPDGGCADGPSRRYYSCNTQPCPSGQDGGDFRAEQCAAFNTVPFEGRFYQWVPYTKAPNKCELNCMPQGERFYYRHKKQVIDGTKCDEEGKQICVSGKCLPVGCDNVLGSQAREDNCRKCGGDGVGCHTVQGVFDNNNLQVGYNDVLLIPVGATNIVVKERRASNNYLAIRNTSNHYYLNGNWRIDFPRELAFAGSVFHYERKPHSFFAPESIRALGPITEPLYVVVLYQESNPGIEYEYSISDKEHQIALTTPGSYSWIYDEFSQCSATCGGGYQQRYVYCAKRTDQSIEYVEEYLCDALSKPPTQQLCNNVPCPLRWYTGAWEPCSAKCGSNETGVQYRTVFCEQTIQGSSAIVNDERRCEIEQGPAPAKVQACTGEVDGGICASWFVGEWSSCSSLCGDGIERRTVKCHVKKDNETTVYPDSACSEAKPEDQKTCYLKPCEGVDWIVGPWSGCKATADPCDDTLNPQETRQVYCASTKGKVYADDFCHDYRKPNASRDCEGGEGSTTPESSSGSSTEASVKQNCQYAWFAMQWGECLLASCTADEVSGQVKGQKSRLVFCGTIARDTGLVTIVEDETKCNETKKYNDTEPCDIDEDLIQRECFDKSAWFTGPWSKCSKDCGQGTRNRSVICMVGNESTTDVKKCGEEGVVFSSEDCTGEDCDTAATEEMIPTPSMDKGATSKPDDIDGLVPGVDCEPDYEEDYYYFYEAETTTTEEPPTTSTEEMSTTSEEDVLLGSTGEPGSAEEDVEGSAEEPLEASGDDEMLDIGKGTTEGVEASGDVEATTTGTTGSESSDSVSDLSSTTTSASTDESATGETATGSESTSSEMSTTSTTEPPAEGETEEESAAEEEERRRRRRRRRRDAEEGEEDAEGDEAEATEAPEGEEGAATEVPEGEEGATTEAAGDESTTESASTASLSSSEPSEGEEATTVEISSGEGEEVEGEASGDEAEGTKAPVISEDEESGSGDMVKEGSADMDISGDGATDQAPRSTPEEAAKEEVKLPKCPPRPTKPTAEPPLNCSETEFGCCPNGEDPAKGPFGAGCEILKKCDETKFGCCPDGVTPAQGKLKIRGCPMEDCEKSLFGCCPDGKKSAEGNNLQGCDKHCSQSEFGCCPDEKTPKKGPKGKGCPPVKCEDTRFGCCPGEENNIAEGPYFEGCKEIDKKNCTASFFGCCLDGKTAALGEKEEGCPEMPPCFSEEFGCCEDEVTSAHGPNKEGCCLSTAYGCCPDNIQPATGRDMEGCTCANSLYGCCPDNVTAARGPDGDCGCKFTEHGCCPDGYTAATGPSNDTCPCFTFQFGCCPDGETVAKGPNKDGCGCEFTEFGCCPDNTYPATGPNQEGCTCANAVHGCCPDGQTEAKGEDFEGCENIPIKPGDVCGLDKERGSCRNFTVKWFFDMEYGGCSRFWYGGCDGNQNRFGTQDECKATCVEPEGRDACYLPQVPGPCEGYYPSWYYDPQREMCLQFVYGGCLGNNNRFATRELCENNCLLPDRVDACDQPKTDGPCKGNFSRYYFDKENSKCDTFQYGGCKGNNNNFLTERECEQRCSREGRIRDSCFLQRQEGPCGQKLARWYYDTYEQRCVPFYYGGCQGNANRFNTLQDCEKTCPAALLAENTCIQPPAVGDCASYTERYYFDPYEQRCKAFVYSGCGGNSNNFMQIDECRNKCERSYIPQPVPPSREFNMAHCVQKPPENGACYGSDTANVRWKWYYDSHDGVCKQFPFYSDCDAHTRNLNRFDSLQECESGCEQSQDVCGLPQVQGPCSGSFPQYYYERETDTCQQFSYGGCQGNGNRFDTITQCEQRCRKAPGGAPGPGYGPQTPDEISRSEEERRRADYYEQLERQRQAQEEERRRVDEERRRQEEEGGAGQDLGQDEICSLPMEIGPCRASIPAFHYDAKTRKCQAFIYGGCSGNANRFESEEMCERQCGTFRGEDVCRISQADPGPCRARIQKWYFNPTDQTCQQFYYGGCAGNGNRFSSREECESICLAKSEIVSANDTISGAAICRLSPNPGPCNEEYKRWYYDWEQNTCSAFVYGGCGGNLNQFQSFESCLDYCQRALEYERQVAAYNQQQQGGQQRPAAEARPQPGSESPENEIGLDECREQLEYCRTLQCPYGVEKAETAGPCPRCACRDPCRNFPCAEDEQCAVDIVGTIGRQGQGRNVYGITHQASYQPVCRKQNKPGDCPNIWAGGSRVGGICAQECNTDADCMAELKCCSNGCGTSCMMPQSVGSPDSRVPPPYTPGGVVGGRAEEQVRILSTTTEVETQEGGLASMECIAKGNPQPQISWRFNNAEVNVETGRFRTVQDGSVLQIVGAYRRDEGVYTCVADNGLGRPATLDITLVVTDPTPQQAAIVEQDTEPNIIVSLGSSASLRCFAMGWPRPSVTWWRGEKMLPFSSERFEQMRDYSLLIRLVSLRDLGPYTCQAYNGQGKAASWTVTVQTIGPVSTSPGTSEDREYLQYVISGPRRPYYTGTNYTRPAWPKPGGEPPYQPGQRPYPAAVTTTSTTERVIIPNYLVPLKTSINLEKTLYPLGNDIVIPCDVEGYPKPSVHWYKDDVPLRGEDRVRIFNENELRIYNATTQDAGTYRCDAVNEFGSASATTSIQVEGVYLHPNCTDNPFFANCKLIVKANYCTNKYYARFCCKSCTLAGQLPQYGPHLHEFGQAYFRRGQVEYAPSNLQTDGSSESRGRHNQVS